MRAAHPLLALAGLLLGSLLVGAPAAAAPLLKVGATVIDDAAALDEIGRVERLLPAPAVLTPEQRSRIKTRAARRLLLDELVRQRAEQEKIRIGPKDIDRAVARERALFRKPEGFDAWLGVTGQTQASFEEALVLRLQREALVKKLLKREPPTEKAALAALEKDPKGFYIPVSFQVRQILFKKTGQESAAELEELRRRVAGVMGRATQNPKAFAELAKSFSEGPTASSGGALGRVRLGTMGHEFDRACYRAAPGTVVGPVETETALHIILVEETFPAEPINFAKAELIALRQLWAQYERETRGPLASRLFRDAKVEILDPDVKIDASSLSRPLPEEVPLPGEPPPMQPGAHSHDDKGPGRPPPPKGPPGPPRKG